MPRKSGYQLEFVPTNRIRITFGCPQCFMEWTVWIDPNDQTVPDLPEGWVWAQFDCHHKVARHVACPLIN